MLRLVAMALVGFVAYNTFKKPNKRVVHTSLSGMKPGGSLPHRPTQMWIDRPMNTLRRDDAHSSTFEGIDAYLRSVYADEAQSHPGVRLVAAAI